MLKNKSAGEIIERASGEIENENFKVNEKVIEYNEVISLYIYFQVKL